MYLWNRMKEQHEFSILAFLIKKYVIHANSTSEIFYVTLGIQPFNYLVHLQLIITLFAVKRGN